jgi:hypothetical protein
VQYVLMIVVALFWGDGALTSQSILFPSKEACEVAKAGYEARFHEKRIGSVKTYVAAECQPLDGRADAQ